MGDGEVCVPTPASNGTSTEEESIEFEKRAELQAYTSGAESTACGEIPAGQEETNWFKAYELECAHGLAESDAREDCLPPWYLS